MTRPSRDSNATDSASSRRFVLLSLVAALVAVSTGLLVGAAVAGDQVAIITASPHAVEADPGEEFTVDVEMISDGGHDGEGVESVTLVARYHPDYLEVTDVERGPWLEQGEESDVRADRTLAHDEGTAVLEQRRDPVRDGATGSETLATLTVEVREDADPADATLSFGETSADLVHDWPLPVVDEEIIVAVDGGGDEVESFDHPDPDELETESTDDEQADDPDGAESAGESAAESGDADGAGSDAIPGFGAALAAGLVVASLLALAIGSSPR